MSVPPPSGFCISSKVLRHFWVFNQKGHSVLLHVTDFMHYLYVAAPVSFTQNDCAGFKMFLESQLGQYQPVIHSVQMVMRENLFGFQGNKKSPFLKITVTDPRSINKVRTAVKDGSANYKGLWKVSGDEILTFDNIQYLLRFMIDTGVRNVSIPIFVYPLIGAI